MLALLSATRGAALEPGDHRRLLEVDGRQRTYLVHVPPGSDPATPRPLVLVFHGGGANADAMVA